MTNTITIIFGCITVTTALIYFITSILTMVGMRREDAVLKGRAMLPYKLSFPIFVMSAIGWFISLAATSVPELALIKMIFGYIALAALTVIVFTLVCLYVGARKHSQKLRNVFYIVGPQAFNVFKVSGLGWLIGLIISLFV